MNLSGRLDAAATRAIEQGRIVGSVIAGVPAPRGMVRWGGIYGHNWFIDPAAGLSVVSMSNTGLEGSDGRFRDDILQAVYGDTPA